MLERGHGHVQFGGQAGGFDPAMHGAEQDGADAGGQLAKARQHDEKQDGEHGMVYVAAQQQAQRQRQNDQQHLDGDQPVKAEIARHYPNHDRDGQRGADQFGIGIADDEHGDQAPDAIERGQHAAQDDGPVLPVLGGGGIVVLDGGARKGAHVELAQQAKGEEEDGHDGQEDRLGLVGGQPGSEGTRQGASKHRPPVIIDRADD